MNDRRTLMGAATALAIGFGCAGLAGAETYVKIDAGSPGNSTHTVAIAFSNMAHKYVDGITVQVSAGKAVPKATVDAAMGKVEFFTTSATVNEWLRTGQKMFKTLDNPGEMHKRIRAVLSYPVGAYQFVVFEDSGIKTFADLRGRKIFVGPKTGAATTTALAVIEAAAGLKPDRDYEAVKLDWNSAMPAFLDRQVDMYVAPTSVPAASISQVALTNKIRLLDIPEKALASPLLAEQMNAPGRVLETLPPDLYGKNQMNTEPVRAIGTWVGIGTHAGVDQETVYQLTKAFWEHIDEVHDMAAWTSQIRRKTAFNQMNVPLHPGAYRYYKEAGFDIPDAVIPTE